MKKASGAASGHFPGGFMLQVGFILSPESGNREHETEQEYTKPQGWRVGEEGLVDKMGSRFSVRAQLHPS